METIDAEPLIAASLRHLVAALSARMEFAPPRESPIEAEELTRERRRARDFERAWKTY